jgi:hypothetical protein
MAAHDSHFEILEFRNFEIWGICASLTLPIFHYPKIPLFKVIINHLKRFREISYFRTGFENTLMGS